MAEDSSSSGILWFLAGLGLGAALGVLYAPKSGKETRESILSAAEEGSEFMRERARQYREQANEFVEKSKDAVSQQREQLRNAFEAGRQAYRDATAQTPAPEGTPSK